MIQFDGKVGNPLESRAFCRSCYQVPSLNLIFSLVGEFNGFFGLNHRTSRRQ